MPALSVGEVITRLQLVFRAAMGSGTGVIRVDFIPGGGGAIQTGISVGSTVSQASYASEEFFGPWTADKVNGMEIAITASPTGESRLNEVRVEIYTNTPPTATPLLTDPTTISTLAVTGEPYRNFFYSDPDGDPQYAIQFKIFSGSSLVVDPGTEVLRLVRASADEVVYSGTIIRLATATPTGPTVWAASPNGPYIWAIRAKDTAGAWGPWGQRSFIFDLPVPPAPVLDIAPQPTPNRYVLSVNAGIGANPTEFFHIQRSDDAGVTWRTVYGADLITHTGFASILYDYHAPRMARPHSPAVVASVGYNEPLGYNAPIGYNGTVSTAEIGPENIVRYRGRAGRIYVGTTLWSAWTTVTPESLVGNGTMWLKHPTDPARSIQLQQVANWETTSEEDMAVLRAASRQDWVVFAGVASLKRGEMELIFAGDAGYQAFEALRAPTTTVPALDATSGSIAPATPTSYLFQSCFGDTVLEQVWMRLGPALSTTRVTTGPQQHTTQYRRVKTAFVETRIPTT
jgi:hypothetical protein